MSPKITKAQLRNDILKQRDALSSQLRADYSARAAEHFQDFDLTPFNVVAGFLPIRSEINIKLLLDQLERRDIDLALPDVINRETIVFRQYDPDMPLVDTGFGTSGPPPEAKILDPDLILMPLSVFDKNGHRIGYGAGHYDRAIARLHDQGQKPFLIGAAFSLQEVEHVPSEPHDVPLDMILTEDGLRSFS